MENYIFLGIGILIGSCLTLLGIGLCRVANKQKPKKREASKDIKYYSEDGEGI